MLFLNNMPRVRFGLALVIKDPIGFINHCRNEHKDKDRPYDCNCLGAFIYIELFRLAAIGSWVIVGITTSRWFTGKGAGFEPIMWLAITALCFTVSALAERVIGWEDWNNQQKHAGKHIQKLAGGLIDGKDLPKLLSDLMGMGVAIDDVEIKRVMQEDPHENPIDKIIRESQSEYRKKKGDLPS